MARAMMVKQGGNAAAVAERLANLRRALRKDVGPEGSGHFSSPERVQTFFKSFAKNNDLKPSQMMFPARVALTGCAQGGT